MLKFLALFALMTFSVLPVNTTSVPADATCKQRQSTGGDRIIVRWKTCPTPQRPYTDRFFNVEQQQKKRPGKNIYEVREFDTCPVGPENGRSCDTNPDTRTCDDGTYPIIRQVIRQGGDGRAPRIVNSFSRCPEDPQPQLPKDAQVVEVVRVSIEQFRAFPIKASQAHSDPSKFSLRNGHTHFWASGNEQSFALTIGDSSVRVRAIPVQWNWDYGDGNTKNFNVPGESSPNHTLHDETPTSHVYKETGKFNVVVTTLYRGEFSVDGGAWQSIPGQAAVPSDPLVMDVWRTQKQLIAFD